MTEETHRFVKWEQYFICGFWNCIW